MTRAPRRKIKADAQTAGYFQMIVGEQPRRKPPAPKRSPAYHWRVAQKIVYLIFEHGSIMKWQEEQYVDAIAADLRRAYK